MTRTPQSMNATPVMEPFRVCGESAPADGCTAGSAPGPEGSDAGSRGGEAWGGGGGARGGGGRGGRLGVLLVLALLLAACASAPRFVGMEAEPLFDRAVALFEDGDWNEAIEAFDQYLFDFPGEARAAEARHFLARAHFEKREFITAAAEFERFLQLWPSHGLAPEASLGVCRSYQRLSPVAQRDQTYTERAVDACRNTMNEFAGMNVAEEARTIQREMIDRLAQREYEDARFYERRGLYDSAILIYQDLVDFFPQSSWAPRGFLGLYRSYRAINWEAEAEQARARLLANYPDSPEARELRDGDGRGPETRG
jgi:outer membrane protein assembly factor BamD